MDFRIIAILGGLFCLGGGIFNWDWFYNYAGGKAAIVIGILGRTGSRIFYTLLGIFLLYMGIAGN